jgi:hypothetical protein
VFESHLSKSGAARASFDRGPLSSTLLLERTSLDQLWKGEAIARFAPWDRFALSGAVSQFRYDDDAFEGTAGRSRLDLRGEGAVRLGRLWLGGGLIRRDQAVLPGLRVFDDSATTVIEPQTTGYTATARGRLFRGIEVDAYGISWDARGSYRPRYQSHAQLFFRSELRSRFPTGNFGLLASIAHDYRSSTVFPVGSDLLVTPGKAQALSGLLEIRIVNAVLSYQIRNAINVRNQFVPFFQAPQTTSVYGVRWEFSN